MKQEVVDLGYVLRKKDYRENDQLITIYFKQYGKMTVIARGTKKIKSKNAIAGLVNHEIEFTFIPRSGLSTLIKASSLRRYPYIEEDLASQIYTSYFQEFLYRHEEENSPNINHYQFLKDLHEKLNQGYPPKLIYALINAYILQCVGSKIQVDHCVLCGNQKNIVTINLIEGGFLCANCAKINDIHYDKNLLKYFRRINRATFEHLDILNIPITALHQINQVLENFIDEYTGIHFNSRKFMNHI